MADTILHSGSFTDQDWNDLIVTFYMKPDISPLTVAPSTLSLRANEESQLFTITHYIGTPTISLEGGDGWLTYTATPYTQHIQVRVDVTHNTSVNPRTATFTVTDERHHPVVVTVSQSGVISNVSVDPNYLVFNKNGETKTATVTWVGGSTPTWSNEPEWASITSSVAGGRMTLTINVGLNTDEYTRTGVVYITNGLTRAELHLEQNATHTVLATPSSFTGTNAFLASGGTKELTITGIEGSFSMNYSGDGLSLVETYVSSTIRKYNVTYSPNTVTTPRTGVINVKDVGGDWVAIPTAQDANMDAFAVSPTSFLYAGTGSTNTFTFTGVPVGGLGYQVPQEDASWVTVSNLTNESVDITTTENDSTEPRHTTVRIYSLVNSSNYVEIAVDQVYGQDSLFLSKSSITYRAIGGTDGFEVSWIAGDEPTVVIEYMTGPNGWLTKSSSSVSGNVKTYTFRATQNQLGMSRTARLRVTNGLQTEYIQVSQPSEIIEYYVEWKPYLSSGTFWNGQNFSDYSSCYYVIGPASSSYTSQITTMAFMSTDISSVSTNVRQIGYSAFKDCRYLRYAGLYNVTSIGKMAFYDCSRLSSIYFSTYLSGGIGDSAFAGCSALTSVDVGCRTLGSHAFEDCRNLSYARITMCSSIGSNAFYNCGLTSISIPSCTHILLSAFNSCSILRSVVLPVCSYIGRDAFMSCVRLSTITLKNSSTCRLYDSYVFSGTLITPTNGSIMVPASLVDAYKSSIGWSYFSNRIFPIPV